jgi:RNA polymerase sigma factor (sigma-70 family)
LLQDGWLFIIPNNRLPKAARTMHELSDQECLAILTASPRDPTAANRAFETLVLRHDGALQRKLSCQYPSLRQDLTDISQDTWMRVWKRLDAKIRPEAFSTWLFHVGKNLAIDLIRKKASRPTTALGEQDIASAQADHVHELGFREKLQQCVEKLSPQNRDFLARLFNLEAPDEIAAALGRKTARIYQIKHEIGKQLLGCLGWLP